MGWVLYNSNYGDINRTALWYAFEISLDNGSTWTKNDLFYKLYYTDSYNDNHAVTDSNVTGSLATDGYTAVQTTNYINQTAIPSGRVGRCLFLESRIQQCVRDFFCSILKGIFFAL